MAFILVAFLTLTLAPAAAVQSSPQEPSQVSPAVEKFLRNVQKYVALKNDAADTVEPIRDPKDPREILIATAALADAIRIRRSGARVGDVFTSEIQSALRLLISQSVRRHGDDAESLVARTRRETIPGGKAPAVNQFFPWQLGAMMPPYLIADLPELPKGLQYRIVERDLILFDLDSNLVVDILRYALPGATVAPRQ
jgi:hypothetical protein